MLVGLLDCHYETEKRTWEWGWLEITLGREINSALSSLLTDSEIPVRWWSTDGHKPKSASESHRLKAEMVLSHKPAPDIVIETHFNHTPPRWHGYLVQHWHTDFKARAFAKELASRLKEGLDLNVPVVSLPDSSYYTSGLFHLLKDKVPFVLFEAGSLDNPVIRHDYQSRDDDSRWWTVLHCLKGAILALSEIS